MKKIIILALFVLFVLCVLSCDGSVYSSVVDSTTETTYAVGDTGPAGGIVFYDKGSYSDGWRYLEAAPADLALIDSTPTVDSTATGYSAGTFRFGYYRPDGTNCYYVNGTTTYNPDNCTGTDIGTGDSNTSLLVSKMGESGENAYYYDGTSYTATQYYAANLCSKLTYGGYDDWFLPSKDELAQMYAQKDIIGGFGSNYYWSSSESSNGAEEAWDQHFGSGSQEYYDRSYDQDRVRPLRAF